MRLIKAHIKSFQSFRDTGEVEFAESINLVIGQNNSGKSSLLRALLPELSDDRHRTPGKWETFKLPQPEVAITLEVSGAEIRDWALRSGSQHHFPAPNQVVVDFAREFFELPSLSISVSREPNSAFSAPYPSHRLFDYVPGTPQVSALAIPNNGELAIQAVGDAADTLPLLLWEAWKREMFYFAAERMTIGEAPPGRADRLQPNASNLPNVLHTLSSERGDVFRQLVHHLREIFSTVGNLSIRTKPNGNLLEVRIWPTEVTERLELSFR